MFAIRLRVRPWRARCSPRSVGRVTRSSPSSCFTSMSRFLRSASSPFGPFTLTSSGSMVISTPSGRATGCFPMRLTSPPPCDQLAAHAGAARLMARHDAPRGRHDRRAHAALHLWQGARLDVLAAARLRHALDALDDRLAVLRVLQAHAQHTAHAGRLDVIALDVALLLRMRAISALKFEAGISTSSRSACRPLRMRVRKSAIGSVSDMVLPAGFGEARDHALVGDLPHADAAEPELAQVRARATAPLAAVVVPRLVLGPALLAEPLLRLWHLILCFP